ncbi:hypothetical protein NX779_02430 [Mycoplasma cottewii]|uniref:Protein CR006 P-loop domain-containing protein n=1 Tax=Mycoplasma cottewii TaxID=51364 RepID=A0ABY5TVR0_9MOLU|nr:hypothetical protein [Mycoplasma cottewii]UWD34650.1 hypothetical protein NX779_02430 [Mycoplasma cottewii]
MISIINNLINYAKNEKNNFIKFIIFYYLNNDCKINEEQSKYLVNSFLDQSFPNIDFDSLLISNNKQNKNIKATIEELNHISGCNALIENENINFCKDVNLIYGANGSGKSSYFRILKKAFSGTDINILPNIHIPQSNLKDIDFVIKWTKNGQYQEYKYSDYKKLLNTNMIFFDTNKQNQIFSKIEKNKYAIYPSDFYIIKDLVVLIDYISKNINNEISEKIKENNEILKEILKEEVLEGNDIILELTKGIENINETKYELIKNYNKKVFTDSYIQTSEDALINHNDWYNLKRISNYLINSLAKLKEYWSLFNKYDSLSLQKEKVLESLDNIKSIAGFKTDSWNQLIKAAHILTEENSLYKERCPYCQRAYDNESLKIVKTYSSLLEDTLQTEIEKVSDDIRGIIESLISQKDKYVDLPEIIDKDQLLVEFINIIKSNLSIFNLQINEFPRLEMDFNRLEELKNHVDSLYNASEQFDHQLYNEMTKKINIVESINQNFAEVSEYIKNRKKLLNLKSKVSAINTKNLSTFFNKNYANFFSEEFTKNYEYYMGIFDKKNNSLKFKSPNVQKGEINSDLFLNTSHNNVKIVEIFSEGEMKAIMLSLIFAEIKTWNNNNPIIFDDPVTSFDNFMIKEFCKIILGLSNQIIIFTHNIFLVDLMLVCKKEGDRDININMIQNLNKIQKGIVIESAHDNFESYMKNARKKLNKPKEINIQECSLVLRLAIESIIDEIILNNQLPRRYTMKGNQQNIRWDKLSKIGVSNEEINTLRECYSKLSQELHKGNNSILYPITYEELYQIYEKLKEFEKKK